MNPLEKIVYVEQRGWFYTPATQLWANPVTEKTFKYIKDVYDYQKRREIRSSQGS